VEVGTAALAEGGGSVGVGVGGICLAQAHSRNRPPPITTAMVALVLKRSQTLCRDRLNPQISVSISIFVGNPAG
jgi:hypothetical protein